MTKRPGGVGLVVQLERGVGAVDLDAAHHQPLGQVQRLARVVLQIGRDQDRLHRSGPPLVDRLRGSLRRSAGGCASRRSAAVSSSASVAISW